MSGSRLGVDAAQAVLADNFAPWIQALELRVEHVGEGDAVLRLPFSPSLCRVGGTICGQALMAAADTAMVMPSPRRSAASSR